MKRRYFARIDKKYFTQMSFNGSLGPIISFSITRFTNYHMLDNESVFQISIIVYFCKTLIKEIVSLIIGSITSFCNGDEGYQKCNWNYWKHRRAMTLIIIVMCTRFLVHHDVAEFIKILIFN
uniref:Uncharacterized protein n=1 Tax=Glossina brevipalpis TaxID=37001 RepID=A0A1A9W476_9MUSC